MNDKEKRTEKVRFSIFITLSLAILIGWNIFWTKPHQEAAKKYALEQKMVAEETQQKIREAIEQDKPGTDDMSDQIIVNHDEAVNSGSRIKISNGALYGSISLKGGTIDDITLVDYKQTIDKNGPDIVLFSPSNTEDVYFADFGWLSANKSLILPNKNTIWQADKDVLNADDSVTLKWDNGNGLVFKRIISVDEHYMFTITQVIENNSGEEIAVSAYGLLSRAFKPHNMVYISHEGPIGVFNGILNELDYQEIIHHKDPKEHNNVAGWLGFADKYWLGAMVPSGNFNARFSHKEINGANRFQVDYLGPETKIQAGGRLEINDKLFAGAKKVDLLDEYSTKYNIPLFDRAVDFGRLYFLTRPLFTALKFFNNLIGNFGLAILMLTILVKILLFPLANKSYKSMAKLRKYMPELKEIQARYKGDKVKLSQETMKFYKEKKVNPASGCLPILLQIPIFFSLYKVLYISLEMRHAPFYGWIHDLSAADYTNIFTLFGLIDWVPPEWLPHIGVLPLIFCATMYIQQEISPPPSDPTQQMVMRFMPIFFVIILAKVPAGLIIYWIWSNTISIFQQLIIMKRIEKAEIKSSIKSLRSA